MKIVLLAFMVCVGAGLIAPCSRNPESLRPPDNSPTPSGDSDLGRRRDDSRERYEGMQEAIKREAVSLGVPNLRDTRVDSQSETRIWVGFGLTYPRCFILRKTDDGHKAFFVTVKVVNDKLVMNAAGKPLMAKTALPPPKSGWGEFERFLKSRGIDSPLGLSLEDDGTSDPDEQYIAIEVKSGDTYGMVSYPLTRGKSDQHKASEVCHRIQHEFKIRMECGEPKTAE